MEAILHADHDSMLQVHTPSKATQFSKLCYTHTNKRLHLNPAMRRDYSSPAARALRRPRRAPRLLVSVRTRSTSTSPCAAISRLRPHALYVNLAVHREYSSPLPRLQRSTSTTPRIRVPRHVARLVTWLVAPLIVDYSGLIVDYFNSAARPGALARRAARHAARCVARRRLLRVRRRLLQLRRASGCLGTSRGSSRGSLRRSSSTTLGSSSTTSPPPRVRVPRHVARLIACRQLLRLRRAAGCLGTSRGSSRGSLRHSSSTTSPTPRVRVPRHVARPVTRLIVDYSVHRDFVLRPRWLYFSHTVRGDYLSRGNTGSTSSTPRTATTSSSPVASRRPCISTSFPN
jgi:hypothetical protein